MAGISSPGGSQDNPIPINVTAMVDVIFCLCIFFMCSFHFRQLEGKVESWLPDHGRPDRPPPAVVREEIRFFLDCNGAPGDAARPVRRAVGSRSIGSDNEMRGALRSLAADFARSGLAEVSVVIDSDPRVPWREVMNVLDICRNEKIGKLEFAGPRAGPWNDGALKG